MTFVHRESVRFRDVDALGHVNNAVFLTYLEQARISFLALQGADISGMILARVEIDFRSPVRLGETVEVALEPTRVGNSSFELAYRLTVGERLVAEATSVLVAYDYGRRQSRTLPEEWRKLLAS